jgi:alanine racemase
MKIAVLPIGYADGFRRSLSNGKGKVFINGKACPVVGRVCMDMTMVDISNLEAKEGDEAIIFNEEHPITAFANDCDTIAYEVLTSIPQRVKRIIVNEA